jgi:hypothetical protein
MSSLREFEDGRYNRLLNPYPEKGDIGDKGNKGEVGNKGEIGEKGDIGEPFSIDGVGTTLPPHDTLLHVDGFAWLHENTGEVWISDGDEWHGPIPFQGPDGDEGEKGQKGDTGLKGDTGAKGDTGSKGEQGDKGDVGQKGNIGQKGDTGLKGDTGAKGDTGLTGIQGNHGGLTLTYQYSNILAAPANPLANGRIRLNDAIHNTTTQMFISEFDIYNAQISAVFDHLSNINSPIKGYVTLRDLQDPSEHLIFAVMSVQQTPFCRVIDIVPVASSGGVLFAHNDEITVSLNFRGDNGIDGLKGDEGEKGEQGLKGDTGEKGDTGAKGD